MSTARPIILVGLSGAGKTTVAELLGPILGTGWSDLDAEIAARAGKSVNDLFAIEGEARFRELERDVMQAILEAGPRVIAAGAGWAAQPGNLGAVTPAAFVVYLSIGIAAAAERLNAATDRPLLFGGAIEEKLAAQLVVRETWYRMADMEIAVDGLTPELVAEAVAVVARQYGGW